MPISQWPKAERPREKLLLRGAAALSDAELLAVFLHTGTRGKSALDLARELLQSCGDISSLFACDRAGFCAPACTHRDLFAGSGRAPDRVSGLLLENHVVAEQPWHANFGVCLETDQKHNHGGR